MDTDRLRVFLRETLRIDVSSLGPDSPLFSTGVLDSMAMVELITFIEQQGGIRLAPEQLTLENIDTMQSILRMVQDSAA